MFQRVALLAAIAGLLAAAGPARADVIRVAQESSPGAGDFDSNVLGFISPFATPGTLQAYYAYNTANSMSFGTNPPNNAMNTGLVTNRSHLFFVEGSNGLGLFVVHDRPGIANGGGTANTSYTIFNSLVGIPVMDDPASPMGDQYASSIMFGQPQNVTANQDWANMTTDGLVLSPLTGDWQVLMSFFSPGGAAAFTGLDSFAAYLSDGSGPIILALQTDRRVQLLPAAIPEPGTLLLGGLMAACGLGYRAARRRVT